MDAKTEIRKFIIDKFYVASPAALSDDASLLDEGIMDSTGVLEVITFIEGSFGLHVEDEEMLPDNLDSIARITAFVARKQSEALRAS